MRITRRLLSGRRARGGPVEGRFGLRRNGGRWRKSRRLPVRRRRRGIVFTVPGRRTTIAQPHVQQSPRFVQPPLVHPSVEPQLDRLVEGISSSVSGKSYNSHTTTIRRINTGLDAYKGLATDSYSYS